MANLIYSRSYCNIVSIALRGGFHQQSMGETNNLQNPPPPNDKSQSTFWKDDRTLKLIWAIGWVGAGLSRLSAGIKYYS